MSHQQIHSEGHSTFSKIPTVLANTLTTISKIPHPFHSMTQRLARFLDPFDPPLTPSHQSRPSIFDFDLSTPEDALMYYNYCSRFFEELQGHERAPREVPSMERMQVPVVVFPRVSSSPRNTPNGSTFTSTRMSTPELDGSEFLEPMLAESTFTRRVESDRSQVQGAVQTKSKPWGYTQYMGMRHAQTGGNTGIMGEQPGAHRSPIYTPQHIESSGVYKTSLTAEEKEQREQIRGEWKDREKERKETEEDNALMDSFDFEPTIRPYVPKYQSSFTDRKGFSSSGASSDGGCKREDMI